MQIFSSRTKFVEVAAKLLRWILAHLRADADGKMIGARERPHVAFEFLEEFHLDDVFFSGHEITEGHFQVQRAERGRFRQQLVARSRCEHHEVRPTLFAAGHQAHLRFICIHACDARAYGRATRRHGAIEQQPVEHFARVDHDWTAHLEPRAMPAAGNQLRGTHDFLGMGAVEQERVRLDGFMGEAAAAGLFPRQALVVDCYVKTLAREAFAAQRAGGSASDNRDVFHGPCDDPVVTRTRPAKTHPPRN